MHDLRCRDRHEHFVPSGGVVVAMHHNHRIRNRGKPTPNQFLDSFGDNEWPHR